MQYFEVFGARAIYKDGWWACSKLDKAALGPLAGDAREVRAPARTGTRTRTSWELYYLPDDFSQAHDLAADNPDKVEELQELWWQEAERNRVLPLMGGDLACSTASCRRCRRSDPVHVRRRRPEHPARHGPADLRALVRDRGRTSTMPDGGAEGVIVANADFIGGFALWVDEQRRLNHTYSFLGVETYKQTSTEKLPTGEVSVKMLFEHRREQARHQAAR